MPHVEPVNPLHYAEDPFGPYYLWAVPTPWGLRVPTRPWWYQRDGGTYWREAPENPDVVVISTCGGGFRVRPHGLQRNDFVLVTHEELQQEITLHRGRGIPGAVGIPPMHVALLAFVDAHFPREAPWPLPGQIRDEHDLVLWGPPGPWAPAGYRMIGLNPEAPS